MNKWFDIKARAASATQASAAEIFIYGDIGESWWNETIGAKDFVEQINALDVDTLTIRINSLGGSVPDGITIYNAIKRHKAKCTVAIDGMAMSIASLIAMAGDTVEMAENALLMIHAPWTSTGGNSVELRATADMLDKWAAAMATSYAAKTGKPADAMLALLTDGQDHYFTAAEAMAEGYIDSITAALAIAASADIDKAKARFQQAKQQPATPAAAAAQPPKETSMPGQQPTNPAANSQDAAVQAAAAAAVAADKARCQEIRAAFKAFEGREGVTAELRQACEDDTSCTVAAAKIKILDAISATCTPVAGGHVVTQEDERDLFRAGALSSIMARANLAKDDPKNSFRSHSLLDLARASLRFCGVNAAGMGKMELVAAAFTHSTSDFPLLLADAANKAMLKGYEEAEETFQKWTTPGTLPDFKAARRVDLNTFPGLKVVPEGGEYQEADFGERGETISLATYGRLFSITRQAIINDDLNAFAKIPRLMGRAAIRMVGDLVYAVLTSNPKMADNKALFHADHNNLLAAAVPSTAALDAMMSKIRLQKDATGNTLNLKMAYALVPVALEGAMMSVAASEFEVGTDRASQVPNIVRNRFETISDARLDTASTSIWYGAANPSMHDTIEVAYLDGVQTPTLEQQAGWTVDGVQFKVRLDAGVKALDFRSLARNA